MDNRQITLTGPGVSGTVVNASVLRDLLVLAIEGSQRALRMRLEGRSTSRGTPPPWLEPAADFEVEVREGSTVLDLTIPTLAEAYPAEFGQRQLFTEVDPDDTAFDYFAEALAAAAQRSDSQLYDRSMLQFFGKLRTVFEHGIDSIQLSTGRQSTPIYIVRESLSAFRDLEQSIPSPQYVQLAGKLDEIRHSDRAFSLKVGDGSHIKGVADKTQLDELHKNWGAAVVVAGTCHFTPAGRVLRIDAETIRTAEERDTRLWSVIPEPLFSEREPLLLGSHQGPRSGLNAIVGRWPGNESDEDIAAALNELS